MLLFAEFTITYLGVDVDVPVTVTESEWTLSGSGTEADPYLLRTQQDLTSLMLHANSENSFSGQYFRMENDLTLPEDWMPLGAGTGYISTSEPGGATVPFSGFFDGDGHTLTIPAGGKCLVGYPKDCVIRNLNVYGEQIEGYGLVDNYTVGVGCTIENVTLKSGTRTLKSGFIGGYGNLSVIIRNCTIEEGVVIGYDRQQSGIGGFAGEFNGWIENCVNHGTVYGVNTVGGIVADKGQTMRVFNIRNCTFDGKLVASGKGAGGIVGSGYGGTGWGIGSAPNTPAVTIYNCQMDGSVTGANDVGGILGAEYGLIDCLSKPGDLSWIMNNLVTGTVSATETPEDSKRLHLGAIVGYYNSINENTHFSNNYYLQGCGAEWMFGAVGMVNTSCAEHETESGTLYVNSADESIRSKLFIEIPAPPNNGKYQLAYSAQGARTDDPLGKDADSLGRMITPAEAQSGALTELLNRNTVFADWTVQNWTQRGATPVRSQEAIPLTLELITQEDKVSLRYHDQEFDLSDTTFKVTWSDGRVTYPDASELKLHSYFMDSWPYEEAQQKAKTVVTLIRYRSAVTSASRDIVDGPEYVASLIEAIGDVSKSSGTAIAKARRFFDILTDAEKEQIPEETRKTLLDAEACYRALTAPVVPVTPSKPSQKPDTGSTLPFTDVFANSWFYDGVKYACEKGFMNGTGSTTFSPDADTTRGMIVTMLARLEGVNTAGTPWYAAGQKWAMDTGISDGTNMTGAVTREQLAAILYRYAKQKGYDVTKSAALTSFTDADTASSYAVEAVQWAVASGLIQGSGSRLSPKATASRAQVATILMRFMELYAK